MEEIIEIALMLKDALKKGKTNFVYQKKNGTIRRAIGTLKNIPDSKKERKGVVVYFDLEKNGFRSCRSSSILEINGKKIKRD